MFWVLVQPLIVLPLPEWKWVWPVVPAPLFPASFFVVRSQPPGCCARPGGRCRNPAGREPCTPRPGNAARSPDAAQSDRARNRASVPHAPAAGSLRGRGRRRRRRWSVRTMPGSAYRWWRQDAPDPRLRSQVCLFTVCSPTGNHDTKCSALTVTSRCLRPRARLGVGTGSAGRLRVGHIPRRVV